MARILIIDDDADLRAILQHTLERAGHEVVQAPNGKIGIYLYQEDPADLVIMDLIMPEKEGIETIRELRRDYGDVKIIAISGGGFMPAENYLVFAKAFGAIATLTKPFRPKVMLELIREILSGALATPTLNICA